MDTLTIAACLKVLAALCGRDRYQDFKRVRQLAETWTSRDIAETRGGRFDSSRPLASSGARW